MQTIALRIKDKTLRGIQFNIYRNGSKIII